MKSLLIFLLSFTIFQTASAEESTNTVYKGTVNNRPVILYLKEYPNPCGGETGYLYTGIYQYGTTLGKNWLELSITDNGKGNFCMTEFGFTGVLILKKTGNTLQGLWISPDGKAQLKVSLKSQEVSDKYREELEERLEKTHYSNHDC